MSDLRITDVRVRPYSKADDKLKAFATITLDNCFVVTDLKVIQGKKGLFVAMPSRKRKDGTFKDVAHPLDQTTRDVIESRVLEAYNVALENGFEMPKSNGEYDEDYPASSDSALH